MKVDLEKGILLKKTIFLERKLISRYVRGFSIWKGISHTKHELEEPSLGTIPPLKQFNWEPSWPPRDTTAKALWLVEDIGSMVIFRLKTKESSRGYQRWYTIKSCLKIFLLVGGPVQVMKRCVNNMTFAVGGSAWRMVWWSKWHDVQTDKAPQLNCNLQRDMNPYMAWTIASRTASFKKNVCLTRWQLGGCIFANDTGANMAYSLQGQHFSKLDIKGPRNGDPNMAM